MAELTIEVSHEILEKSYYRTGDVEPDLEEGNKLTIYTGKGKWERWGAPSITSKVILHEDNLASIHVGYWTRYSKGQLWRHYQLINEEWRRRTWPQLHDRDRLRVLIGYEDKAFGWADAPGDLRENYKVGERARSTQISYKLVEVSEDGKYRSIYDRNTTYTLNKWLQQKAVEKHGGGYYSYPYQEAMLDLFNRKKLFDAEFYTRPMNLAILKCEIGGTLIPYGNKIASTYIRPIEEMGQFTYTPEPVAQEV